MISSFSAIGNYDYGFFWYLYQDGSIEFEVKLTGVLSTGAVAPGVRPEHGVLVAPGLNAMVHQHFFGMRLDLDVDGLENAVEEVWTESLPPGPGNPVGNAFRPVRRRLETELEARRRLDPASARWWEIVNPGVRHRLGEPVAYRLVPGENAVPFAQPDAPVSKRAGLHPKPSVGDAVRARRALRGRRVPEPAPRRRRACRSGRAPTGPSRAATSSSGIRSATTTCPGRRTGR